MALDFPNAPLTVGQQYTGGGVTWTWDGAKWAPAGLGPGFLALTGGALTGDLSITGPDANTLQLSTTGATIWPGVKFNMVSGKGAWLGSYVGVNERWELDLGNGIAETGANVGSNFQIARYSDGGVFIDDPLIINRANGSAYFTQPIVAPNITGSNRLINGDCWIDQWHNGGVSATTGYVIDRWYLAATAANLIQAQRIAATGAPLNAGFPYCLNCKSLSAHTIVAADSYFLQQPIEADMVSDFRWGTANAQPVTLSFWAMSSKTGSFSGAIENYAGTRSYPFSYSLPTASTWTFITITIPGDTAGAWAMSGNGGGPCVNFDLGSGSTFKHAAGAWAANPGVGVTGGQTIVNTNNATFSLTGVKLEIGSIATPFARRPLAGNLADCQRYYERSYDLGTVTGAVTQANMLEIYMTGVTVQANSAGLPVSYKVTKRVSPTIAVYSPLSGAAGAIADYARGGDVAGSAQDNGTNGFIGLASQAGAASSIDFGMHWTAIAEL